MDISTTLISLDDEIGRLTSIFKDALILDNHFVVRGIGNQITEEFGFTLPDLLDQDLTVLGPEANRTIAQRLKAGYFDETRVTISNKKGEETTATISGFYTGLISDVNGMVVVRIRSMQDVINAYRQLQSKSYEMDEFIYQASHGLRGPLATIRGLVNIVERSPNGADREFIFSELKRFADDLDQKLYKLIYLAEVGRNNSPEKTLVDFEALESRLRSMLQDWKFIQPIAFTFHNRVQKPIYQEGTLLESLFSQMFLFIISLENQGAAQMTVFINQHDEQVVITFNLQGFTFEPHILSLLTETDSYANLLKKPEFLNLYALKKILKRLHGQLSGSFSANKKITISMEIPMKN